MTEALTQDAPADIAGTTPVVSPWLTLLEAAEYSKFTYRHVRNACIEYQRYGDRGLKCAQPDRFYRIHVADLDRWIEGLAPTRARRRTSP